MTTFKRCDVCGKDSEQTNGRYRLVPEMIVVEHDEDEQCFDACSWACVAQRALERAALDVETSESP